MEVDEGDTTIFMDFVYDFMVAQIQQQLPPATSANKLKNVLLYPLTPSALVKIKLDILARLTTSFGAEQSLPVLVMAACDIHHEVASKGEDALRLGSSLLIAAAFLWILMTKLSLMRLHKPCNQPFSLLCKK